MPFPVALARSMTVFPSNNWSPVAALAIGRVTVRLARLAESMSVMLVPVVKLTALAPVSDPLTSVKVATLLTVPVPPSSTVGATLAVLLVTELIVNVAASLPTLSCTAFSSLPAVGSV